MAPRSTTIVALALVAAALLAQDVQALASGNFRIMHPTAATPEAAQRKAGLKRAPAHNGNSTWALFRINTFGDATLVAVKPSHQPVSACRELAKEHVDADSSHVVLTYVHPVDGEDCHLPIKDPRKMYHDHEAEGTKGKFAGGIANHDEAEFAIALHPEAAEVHVTDYATGAKSASRHAVTLEHHRAMEAMQVVTLDPTLVVPETIQIVGPMAIQKNIVFLSSGYTAAQQSNFDSDVANLVAFMQLPENNLGVSSQPYMRYFSVTNVFKVFYPSSTSGASHPAPAGDGSTADNNLACTYGASSARILTCARNRVLLLGSYAPPDTASSLYIVLVNDPMFGGTGGSGVCSIYNGARMPVVFIHEVGHASSALADEYSYGTSETNRVSLPNCYWSNADPPWANWILAGILPTPSPVCTYDNYFKPTPAACLMESDQPSMCPVCTAEVLRLNYQGGLDLAAPRYPGKYEELVLVNGESMVLRVNSRIPYHRDETGTFTVTWSVDGTVLTRGTHEVGVAPANGASAANATTVHTYATVGSFIVSATIEDNTNMFLAATRASLSVGTNSSSIRQVHQFRVRVVGNLAERVASNCTTRNHTGQQSYCAICDPGHDADCALSFASKPIQFALDLNKSLGALETWMLSVGGVFAVLGVLVFFLIWKSMQLQSQTRVREVLPLSTGVKAIRVILMLTQCLMLVGSTVIVIFSIYMYTIMSVFGRAIIVGIIAVACVVWFASFLGFCAAYYKNRVVLFVNFALLLMLFGLAVLFTMLLAYVLINIDTDGVKNQLHTEWKDAVSNDPFKVCTLQDALICSGFNTSCVTVNTPAGTTDCPRNCEIGNQIAFPCFLRIREFVLDKFLLACLGGGMLALLLFSCMILAIVLGCKIKTQKVQTWRRRAERKKAGESALTPEEVAMLEVEFKKIDIDGSGDISREEFGSFYNDVMGTNLTARQLDEYFDKLDSDGNGTLSFDEFIKVYKPMKKPKKRSLKDAQAERDKSLADTAEQTGVFGAGEKSMAFRAQAEEEAAENGSSGVPQSAQSQRSARIADIDLDLQLDDDVDLFQEDEGELEAMAAAAELQEKQHQDEQAAVVTAQAERQKRHALEQPNTMDVENVLGDLAGDLAGDDDFGDFDNMDLDIDLDEDY